MEEEEEEEEEAKEGRRMMYVVCVYASHVVGHTYYHGDRCHHAEWVG